MNKILSNKYLWSGNTFKFWGEIISFFESVVLVREFHNIFIQGMNFRIETVPFRIYFKFCIAYNIYSFAFVLAVREVNSHILHTFQLIIKLTKFLKDIISKMFPVYKSFKVTSLFLLIPKGRHLHSSSKVSK